MHACLQEITFDCVIAIAKICLRLNQAIGANEALVYEDTARGRQAVD